ncbi:zinc-binding dehydrogenase [Nocardia niwae]|uniref:Zinc-binding dehydrogenase n=1 Tax=Nocardia niwae TaxID=626084 RepID=A0ABV2X3N1_9NOCA
MRGLGAGSTAVAVPGWDAVADAAALQAEGLALVCVGGLFVGVRPGMAPAGQRDITVRAVETRFEADRLTQLLDATVSGRLPAPVHAMVPLDRAAAVHRAVGKGGVRGKYVLRP